MAVGKTTIARTLAEMLDADHVAVDDVLVRHRLARTDLYSGRLITDYLIAADDIMLPQAEEGLKGGKVVIFDHCFYDVDHLDDILQRLQYPHFIFSLHAPVDVCIERNRTRPRSWGGVRRNHRYVSQLEIGIGIDVGEISAEQAAEQLLSHLPET